MVQNKTKRYNSSASNFLAPKFLAPRDNGTSNGISVKTRRAVAIAVIFMMGLIWEL